MPVITTDGLAAYPLAIGQHFGPRLAPMVPAIRPIEPSSRLPMGQLDLFGLDLEPEPKK